MKVNIGPYRKHNKKTKKTPPRKIKIQVDRWDSWSADHTIALLVVPILKQLKKTKHGAPYTDDDDVPENIRSTVSPAKTENDVDKNFFKRWNWILNEMIWAFDQHTKDWESKFHHGKIDMKFIKQDDGNYLMERGPKDTHTYDEEGAKKHWERMQNGVRLFAKYYHNLWD
jgi:hypothetical protein